MPVTITTAFSDNVLTHRETTRLTVQFSAAVSGFEAVDLTSNPAGGPTFATPVSGDGGITWTVEPAFERNRRVQDPSGNAAAGLVARAATNNTPGTTPRCWSRPR